MKQTDAIQDLVTLKMALEFYKKEVIKLTKEEAGDPAQATVWVDALGDAYPWVFGDKDIVPHLEKIIERACETNRLDPMNHYNMLTVLVRFIPEVWPLFNEALVELGREPLTDLGIPGPWDPEETP